MSIERACILADGEFITEREFRAAFPEVASAAFTADPAASSRPRGVSRPSSAIIFSRCLPVSAGTKRKPRGCWLDRRSLYRRLESYGFGLARRQ